MPPWFSKPSTTWMKLDYAHKVRCIVVLWSCECWSAISLHFRFVRWGTKSESPKNPWWCWGSRDDSVARDFPWYFPMLHEERFRTTESRGKESWSHQASLLAALGHATEAEHLGRQGQGHDTARGISREEEESWKNGRWIFCAKKS